MEKEIEKKGTVPFFIGGQSPFFSFFLSCLFFFQFPGRADTVIVGDGGIVIVQPEDADGVAHPEKAVNEAETLGSERQAEVKKAQATMASLFGKNAVISVPPRMGGTVALPSFDSKNMKIDQGAIERDQRSKAKD